MNGVRLERWVVCSTAWAWSVWVAAVLTTVTFGLIFWVIFGHRAVAMPVETQWTTPEEVASYLPPPPAAGQVYEMEATGYSQSVEEGTADGITASGLPVAPGMAAADPEVLPPGTVVRVEDYGYALVGDVGSAIKGARIDLFFPTRAEAFAWGRRPVRVEVVQP